ncbi:tyrosine-type recombinase/integrase [Guyparkeria hydrothermalis]|uniref:tyrosine-type recombinase/integrase n=1 Tax=Guyparkeria hydrothermalis TaxID=923 RepID=UPI00201FF956|nr:site-specific integrase [Guyparkeria hydrothermalis]MCL7744353.1 tyrosine-type recombinase/integrase [Guyparkeria hydrothermalis]
MAKTLHRLTARQVTAKSLPPGVHHDGGGLYLQNREHGHRSWLFRFTHDGKRHWMGLGSIEELPLAEAREQAAAFRAEVKRGINPMSKRRENYAATVSRTSRAMTFEKAMDRFLAAKSAQWSNDKHAKQWRSTLTQYALPKLGSMPVSEITTDDVLRVLEGQWLKKTETMNRVRGRIEKILDWATAAKHREGDNPARWRGNLKELLADPTTAKNEQHFAALPYDQVADFVGDLRGRAGMSAKAAEFVILTAARTTMVRGATWDEIDLEARVWTIPAERMKGRKNQRREHKIPLSDRAVEILESVRGDHPEIVFPSTTGRAMSENAMLALLKRMDRRDVTIHGFRSTFRDWAAETTHYPHEVVEMALAHTIKNKAEAAYRRGDLLEKRRALMQEWADYCQPAKEGLE